MGVLTTLPVVLGLGFYGRSKSKHQYRPLHILT